MSGQVLDLNGYTDVPDGKIAFVVTYLEMLQAPEKPLAPPRPDLVLERWTAPDLEEYRALFRKVGGDWIWFGRLTLDDATLGNKLEETARECFRPVVEGTPAGILELDYANPAEPALAYFGLIPEAIGAGVGRWLMGQAVGMAWSRPDTKRLWLHTCTGDSPQAIGFYMSCGFRPYKRAVEVDDDPRLLGFYPKDKAPHVPVIERASE